MKLLESYPAPPDGAIARRYWALPGRVLCGGAILSPGDAQHLRDAYGVTHVLSAQIERSDSATWGPTCYRRCGFDDNANAPPLEVVKSARDFAWDVLRPGAAANVLYTHCRLGRARGPAYAYLALRLLGAPPADALSLCAVEFHHAPYFDAVETALRLP